MQIEHALAGQVALITGASRGIGLAMAGKLGRMGARLTLYALPGCPAAHRKEGAAAGKIPLDNSRCNN